MEVVYRGIFQKTLARNIVRSIVFAARKDGKIGTAFGRYGDSPERNGIPAKQFAIVADDSEELEESLAVYQANEVDVTINVDDTMCKGIESWAWYGLQPINELTKPGGTLIVTSRQQADALLEDIHPKETPYNLSIVTGIPSFSGLWVYKDDHTDARILGALCKVCPDLVSLDAMLETIEEQMGGGTKIASAQRSFDRTATRPVEPGEGGNQREMKCRDARLEDHAGRSGHSGHTRRGRIRRGRGRLRARPKRGVQEVQHPLHAPGHQLRYLHQMHPLLAAMPGYLLRRYPRRPV